jgi:hypothetical protein
MSQYMLNMQNHFKNLKMVKMGKIKWNREFRTVFMILTKKTILQYFRLLAIIVKIMSYI